MANTYLMVARSIVGDGFGDEPGDISFVQAKASHDDYSPSESVRAETWKRRVIAAADGVEDEITGSTGELLFFVHGYNNDRKTVLWRTRTLQETLNKAGWKGLVVAFDWPSGNSTLNYLEDRSDGAQVATLLVEQGLQLLVDAQFPNDPSQAPCTINVHMLGHSTGAYVIMEAFTQAEKQKLFYQKPWRIAQVAFIAGDVAASSLSADSDWAKPMYSRIMRLTNYSNGFDKVLGVSNMKRMGTSPRAGRVGLPIDVPRKAINVDCSAHFSTKDPATSTFAGTFNHSWHIGDADFALDLALTLDGSMDRAVIPTRYAEQGQLFLRTGATRPSYQNAWDENRAPAQ